MNGKPTNRNQAFFRETSKMCAQCRNDIRAYDEDEDDEDDKDTSSQCAAITSFPFLIRIGVVHRCIVHVFLGISMICAKTHTHTQLLITRPKMRKTYAKNKSMNLENISVFSSSSKPNHLHTKSIFI